MAPPDEDDAPNGPAADEPTVRQLLDRDQTKPLEQFVDAATAAELERWFGLPSYTEVEERGGKIEKPEDPGITAVRERRAAAIAAVDPALLEAHRRRLEPPADLLKFQPNLRLAIETSVTSFDPTMVERGFTIAEPREREIHPDLEDDMKDCAPQALLRDLHRPELEFEKLFEVSDVAAMARVDLVAEIATAMTTSWKLPEFGPGASLQASEAWGELRAQRNQSWPAVFATLIAGKRLPNRRVQE